MGERALRPLLCALVLSTASVAHAERDDPAIEEERDRLLDRITRGVEFDASVKRLGELIRQRDKTIATTARARDDERAAAQAKREWWERYRKTADYEASWRCTLTPDPAHPLPTTESKFKPDWGKVVRKEKTRLAPKNALDEGEPVTMYEVAGIARRYVFQGKHLEFAQRPFEAEVGELVLICHGGEATAKDLPAGWGERHVRSGFAARLARPPLIVDKASFQPIHITSNAFFWAIKDVKWKWPGQHVLSSIEIGRDLGGGRWEIALEQNLSWVLEVPPGLKKQDILVPGHHVWAILGDQRFDAQLRKLVLVAHDLEPTYIFEKP